MHKETLKIAQKIWTWKSYHLQNKEYTQWVGSGNKPQSIHMNIAFMAYKPATTDNTYTYRECGDTDRKKMCEEEVSTAWQKFLWIEIVLSISKWMAVKEGHYVKMSIQFTSTWYFFQ